MKRIYVSTADRYAPLDSFHDIQGLGASNQWPAGRSYYDVSQYRAPYRVGYFQDGSLMGLGAIRTLAAGAPAGAVESAIDQNAPPDVKRFLIAGEPVPTLSRDLSLPFNQTSRTAYAIIGVLALGISYVSYKQFRKRQKAQSGGHP